MPNTFTTGHVVTASEYDADVSRLGAWVVSTRTTNVTTTGTSWAAGADLLASALTITADGASRYLVRVRAPSWSNSVSGVSNNLSLNIDSADQGIMAYWVSPAAGGNGSALCVEGVTAVLSSGSHTINVRFWVGGASTGTVFAGAGGAATNTPLLVAVAVI